VRNLLPSAAAALLSDSLCLECLTAGSLLPDGRVQALYRAGDIEIFNSEKTPRSRSGGV